MPWKNRLILDSEMKFPSIHCLKVLYVVQAGASYCLSHSNWHVNDTCNHINTVYSAPLDEILTDIQDWAKIAEISQSYKNNNKSLFCGLFHDHFENRDFSE